MAGNVVESGFKLSQVATNCLQNKTYKTTNTYAYEAASCCVCVKSFSRVRLFATAWTVVSQALLSMGFPRQEYRSGLPFPPPGDLPNSGIKPRSSALQVDSL